MTQQELMILQDLSNASEGGSFFWTLIKLGAGGWVFAKLFMPPE